VELTSNVHALLFPKAVFQHLAGLLTYSLHPAFPTNKAASGFRLDALHGTYSSGYCSGFSPDSLFSLKKKILHQSPDTGARIGIKKLNKKTNSYTKR
jgi:hypothetical protein